MKHVPLLLIASLCVLSLVKCDATAVADPNAKTGETPADLKPDADNSTPPAEQPAEQTTELPTEPTAESQEQQVTAEQPAEQPTAEQTAVEQPVGEQRAGEQVVEQPAEQAAEQTTEQQEGATPTDATAEQNPVTETPDANTPTTEPTSAEDAIIIDSPTIVANTTIISESQSASKIEVDDGSANKVQAKVAVDAGTQTSTDEVSQIRISIAQLQRNFQNVAKMIKRMEVAVKKSSTVKQTVVVKNKGKRAGAQNLAGYSPNMPYGPYWYGFNPFGMYGVGFHKNHAKSKGFKALQGTQKNYRAGSFNYVVNDSMKPQVPFPLVPFY